MSIYFNFRDNILPSRGGYFLFYSVFIKKITKLKFKKKTEKVQFGFYDKNRFKPV